MSLNFCSLAAKGLWIDMLSIMGISEKVGFLQIGGKPITDEQLATMEGISINDVKKYLKELEDNKVFSRDENGIPYSRRMARESQEFEQAREYGKQGGNPILKAKSNSPEARSQKLEATVSLTPTIKRGVKGTLSSLNAKDKDKIIPPTPPKNAPRNNQGVIPSIQGEITSQPLSQPPPVKAKETWLTAYDVIFFESFGGHIPCDESARTVKRLEKDHGRDKALSGWRVYCQKMKATGQAQWASIFKYAEHPIEWMPVDKPSYTPVTPEKMKNFLTH